MHTHDTEVCNLCSHIIKIKKKSCIDSIFLGYDTASMGNWIPAFQGNVVPSVIRFFKDPLAVGEGTVFP